MTSSKILDGSSSADMWRTLKRLTASSILPRLRSKVIQWRSSLGWRFLLTITRQLCLMPIMKKPTVRILMFWNWIKYTTSILFNSLVLSTRHVSLLVTLKSKYILSTTTNKIICIRHAWWTLVILLGPILTLTILALYHFVPFLQFYSYLNWTTLRQVLVTPVILTWLYALMIRLFSTLDPSLHPLDMPVTCY